MAGLENLQTRLEYRGGVEQQNRMIQRKLESLKKALKFSYQAATAILSDKSEFRCLMNPDRLYDDVDEKIISIPFKDIELISKQEKATNIKVGDIFTWKETSSDWIVSAQRLEERAYFRADVKKCNYEIDIDGITYKVFIKRRPLKEIPWITTHNVSFNELDYFLEMYITKDENTENYFSRFQKIFINGSLWEVQAVDKLSVNGIVRVAFKETYENSIEEEIKKEKNNKPKPESIPEDKRQIIGETIVYPYDELVYTVENTSGGLWEIDSAKAKIINQNDKEVNLVIVTGRSGNFNLLYKKEGQEDIVLNITIESL